MENASGEKLHYWLLNSQLSSPSLNLETKQTRMATAPCHAALLRQMGEIIHRQTLFVHQRVVYLRKWAWFSTFFISLWENQYWWVTMYAGWRQSFFSSNESYKLSFFVSFPSLCTTRVSLAFLSPSSKLRSSAAHAFCELFQIPFNDFREVHEQKKTLRFVEQTVSSFLTKIISYIGGCVECVSSLGCIVSFFDLF